MFTAKFLTTTDKTDAQQANAPPEPKPQNQHRKSYCKGTTDNAETDLHKPSLSPHCSQSCSKRVKSYHGSGTLTDRHHLGRLRWLGRSRPLICFYNKLITSSHRQFTVSIRMRRARQSSNRISLQLVCSIHVGLENEVLICCVHLCERLLRCQ